MFDSCRLLWLLFSSCNFMTYGFLTLSDRARRYLHEHREACCSAPVIVKMTPIIP
jgi:hypothetical protein